MRRTTRRFRHPAPARSSKKYEQLHPENIRQKSEIIVETFRSTTRMKINGKAKK